MRKTNEMKIQAAAHCRGFGVLVEQAAVTAAGVVGEGLEAAAVGGGAMNIE